MTKLYARLEPTIDIDVIKHAADRLLEPDHMDVILYNDRKAESRKTRFPHYFNQSKPKPGDRFVMINFVNYRLEWLKPLGDNRRQLTFA